MTDATADGRSLEPFPARRISIFRAGARSWELGRITRVLGIVNCTPDSFSDGGSLATMDAIRRRLWQIAEEGGDIADIGGESTRPGAAPVGVEEEWSRIEPALREAGSGKYPIAVSVDTMKPEVARRALDQGAVIINDVSGLRLSGLEMASLAARHDAGLILMHMKGEPRTMQRDPRYEDLLGEVRFHLEEAVNKAISEGVASERILVDPGVGFGKTLEQNITLIRGISTFGGLGAGILVGTSRKSFLGMILGGLPVDDRLEGSLASFVVATLAGAHVIRVHDVRAAVRAVRIADALRGP
jgi:dihydropteroate synthase